MSIYEQLQSIQSDMRPWVFDLVSAQLQRALHDGDEVAVRAYRWLLNPEVLFVLSDVQQFRVVSRLLAASPHAAEHVSAIGEAFAAVHGGDALALVASH